jgi:hypothetical protein
MKTTKIIILATALALSSVALWACKKDNGQSGPAVSPEAQQMQDQDQGAAADSTGMQPEMMQQMKAGCPMLVQGVEVEASDTDSGVMLAFTTETGDVADLQQRVHHMAQMYQMHGGHGGMMWQHMGEGGMGHGGGHMGHMAKHGQMPAASAQVTELKNGARLELTPTDPGDLVGLREHVRMHQQRMQSGECWMLQEQPETPTEETRE